MKTPAEIEPTIEYIRGCLWVQSCYSALDAVGLEGLDRDTLNKFIGLLHHKKGRLENDSSLDLLRHIYLDTLSTNHDNKALIDCLYQLLELSAEHQVNVVHTYDALMIFPYNRDGVTSEWVTRFDEIRKVVKTYFWFTMFPMTQDVIFHETPLTQEDIEVIANHHLEQMEMINTVIQEEMDQGRFIEFLKAPPALSAGAL